MPLKLKRMPGGMSYDEVRARQIKNDAGVQEEPDVDPSNAPVTPEVSEAPVSQTEHDQIVASAGKAEPDQLAAPLAEPEPAKPAAEPSTLDDNTRPLAMLKKLDRAVQEDAHDRSDTLAQASRNRIERVTIKGYSAQPACGVSATYDAIAPVYGDKAAMKHLLDVALTDFQEALDAGEVDRVQIDPIYTSVPKKHQVSRNIPRRIYEVLADKIDPSGILKPGTIGRTIVQGALNRLIAEEQKRQKKDAARG